MFMKQKILLAVLSLLCATFATAATIDVKTNLWPEYRKLPTHGAAHRL